MSGEGGCGGTCSGVRPPQSSASMSASPTARTHAHSSAPRPKHHVSIVCDFGWHLGAEKAVLTCAVLDEDVDHVSAAQRARKVQRPARQHPTAQMRRKFCVSVEKGARRQVLTFHAPWRRPDMRTRTRTTNTRPTTPHTPHCALALFCSCSRSLALALLFNPLRCPPSDPRPADHSLYLNANPTPANHPVRSPGALTWCSTRRSG